MTLHRGTKGSVQKPLQMLLVLTAVCFELAGGFQKCVFDEVQSQVRGVTGAAANPNQQSRFRGPSRPEPPLTSSHQTRSLRSTAQQGILGNVGPEPIRIKTWTVRESQNLTEVEKERLEAAVEEAVKVVSSLLSVTRLVKPLLLSRDINKYCKFVWKNSSSLNYNRCGRANRNYRSETCLDVTIPDDHLSGCDTFPHPESPQRAVLRPDGAGSPHTDFLLYINVQATDKCGAELDLLAYAVHCRTDARGRPVGGVLVICTDRLTGAASRHPRAVQAVIHELIHVLGFSKQLFSSWRDCSSSPQGAPCSPRGRVIHADASGQMRIYSPSIVSALQRHLLSPDPELGGPLENLDAAAGRASSHWESRLLQGSIMAAVLGDPATVRLDPVTLAALKDTGWYSVNMSRAQSLVWGDSEGATFGSLLTCKDNSSSFFCTGSGVGCHFLHLHKGKCQTDEYLEGCRVYKPLKNGSECWKEENSRWSSEDSGEIFGFDSRCFFSSLTLDTSVQMSGSAQGRCYRHRCSGQNRYQIQVSGSGWSDCPAGGSIQIKGYGGSVLCPDKRLCSYPDVAPPQEQSDGDSPETVPSAHSWTGSALRSSTWAAVVTSSCVAAGFFAALLVTFMKFGRCVIRINAVTPELNNHVE